MYSWSFIASVSYENVDFKNRCSVFCNHLSKAFIFYYRVRLLAVYSVCILQCTHEFKNCSNGVIFV